MWSVQGQTAEAARLSRTPFFNQTSHQSDLDKEKMNDPKMILYKLGRRGTYDYLYSKWNSVAINHHQNV